MFTEYVVGENDTDMRSTFDKKDALAIVEELPCLESLQQAN